MNIETLINLNETTYINSLTIAQLSYLITEAKNAMSIVDKNTVTYLSLLALIRSLELRLAEIENQPRPIAPQPRPTL